MNAEIKELIEERDPAGALFYARQHARDKGAPPHWLRCEWMCDGERCRLGDDHAGPHQYPVPT